MNIHDDENIQSFSNAFDAYLKNTGLYDKIKKSKVITQWKDIVGPHIARNTHQLKFNNNILIVYVKSPALKHELMYMKQQLIQNIHHHIKEEFIEDIIFY